MNKKEGYVPKEERKKILLICDDIRVHSGVATVAREFVTNTSHVYNYVNVGGAIKHPDAGKKFDLSEDTNKTTGTIQRAITRSQIALTVNELLIIEFYSRKG